MVHNLYTFSNRIKSARDFYHQIQQATGLKLFENMGNSPLQVQMWLYKTQYNY